MSEPEVIYCANCDNEATHETVWHEENTTPLCSTCKEAYTWGQGSPEAIIYPLGEVPKKQPDAKAAEREVKCVVAGTNASGEPDFFFVIIECTEKQRQDGDHYAAAQETAEGEGYEEPFVCFDEQDPPMHGQTFGFIDLFEWDTASVVGVEKRDRT